MFNRMSDNDDFTYLGSPQPMFKKYSILSNLESSEATETYQAYKQAAYIPDNSLDWDSLNAKKALAQVEWNEKLYNTPDEQSSL